MADLNDRTSTTGATRGAATTGRDWSADERYWQENYSARPYARADRSFDHVRGAYRYGHESANRYQGREWNDVEGDLRRGWDSYEHRGEHRSTWEEIKDAVKDAWNKVRH
jgi:hypothetical protein